MGTKAGARGPTVATFYINQSPHIQMSRFKGLIICSNTNAAARVAQQPAAPERGELAGYLILPRTNSCTQFARGRMSEGKQQCNPTPTHARGGGQSRVWVEVGGGKKKPSGYLSFSLSFPLSIGVSCSRRFNPTWIDLCKIFRVTIYVT